MGHSRSATSIYGIFTTPKNDSGQLGPGNFNGHMYPFMTDSGVLYHICDLCALLLETLYQTMELIKKEVEVCPSLRFLVPSNRSIVSVHDLLGTRCDPYVNRMLSGKVHMRLHQLDFDINLVRISTIIAIRTWSALSIHSGFENRTFMMVVCSLISLLG